MSEKRQKSSIQGTSSIPSVCLKRRPLPASRRRADRPPTEFPMDHFYGFQAAVKKGPVCVLTN